MEGGERIRRCWAPVLQLSFTSKSVVLPPPSDGDVEQTTRTPHHRLALLRCVLRPPLCTIAIPTIAAGTTFLTFLSLYTDAHLVLGGVRFRLSDLVQNHVCFSGCDSFLHQRVWRDPFPC